MAELRPRPRDLAPNPAPHAEERGHCGLAEREDDLQVREEEKLSLEERLTPRELGPRRQVFGRGAPDGGGDEAIPEDEAVVTGNRDGLVRETGAVKGPEEPFSAAIPGEYPSCAIPAMGRGREADHEQTRGRIAERGYGPAPIFLVRERALSLPGHSLPPPNEAWTSSARDDLRLHGGQAVQDFHHSHRQRRTGSSGLGTTDRCHAARTG